MSEAIEAGGSAPPIHAEPPRRTFRMKQPTKDELRRQLEVERTENQRLRCVLQDQWPAWQVVVFGAVLGIGLSALAWCLA